MGTRELTYALPVSCIQVEGTITETIDDVLAPDTPEYAPAATAALHVHGLERDQTLKVKTGWLFDTNLSLELTDDGRLKSTSAESTGQLGKVVLGVAGAGATIAGLLTSPAATLAASAALAGGREAHKLDAPEREQTDDEKVAAAYAGDHEEIAALRAHYLALIEKTAKRAAEHAKALVDAPDSSRLQALAELRRDQQLLPILRAELEPLNTHFKAWRASTIHTRTETHQRCFSLDTLRAAAVTVTDGEVTFSANAAASVRFAWAQLGIAVTMDPPDVPRDAQSASRDNAILVRLPRRVRLDVYEKVGEKAVLRESRPYLVVDAASPTDEIELRRSLWAKRFVKVGFSDLGVVTSFEHTTTAAAAAIGDTLGALPAGVAGGLESASKIRTQQAALRSAGLDEQVSTAKQRFELKEHELKLAGLTATEADYAELERLKQQAEIAEKTPAETTPAAKQLAELKRQLDLLTTQRGVATATRQLEAETQLGALKLEVERLRLEAARANPGATRKGKE